MHYERMDINSVSCLFSIFNSAYHKGWKQRDILLSSLNQKRFTFYFCFTIRIYIAKGLLMLHMYEDTTKGLNIGGFLSFCIKSESYNNIIRLVLVLSV